MILTNCAACAAPLAHDAPRCVRCWTRYCDSTCHYARRRASTYAPADWVAMNRVEWAELHHRLAGREVPVADQLAYFFDAAPAWCGPDPREARE